QAVAESSAAVQRLRAPVAWVAALLRPARAAWVAALLRPAARRPLSPRAAWAECNCLHARGTGQSWPIDIVPTRKPGRAPLGARRQVLQFRAPGAGHPKRPIECR